MPWGVKILSLLAIASVFGTKKQWFTSGNLIPDVTGKVPFWTIPFPKAMRSWHKVTNPVVHVEGGLIIPGKLHPEVIGKDRSETHQLSMFEAKWLSATNTAAQFCCGLIISGKHFPPVI